MTTDGSLFEKFTTGMKSENNNEEVKSNEVLLS